MTRQWNAKDIPDQTGRVAIVTGGNSGIGYESVLALARKGAFVVMACRNQTKALEAVNRIKQQAPEAKVEAMSLDLASLASVRAFASEFKLRFDRLDILLNNAGIAAGMRQETEDGFEMHFGVNHLGHFALTGLLLNKLLSTPESRVITTTSVMQTVGLINFADLQLKHSYTRVGAYGQSKLANLLFAFELDRHLKAAGATTISVAAHPGYSRTQMTQNSSNTIGAFIETAAFSFTSALFAQSAEMGALPQLYAATAPGVEGGEMYGPRLYGWGYPAINVATIQAFDREAAQRLWQVSEDLTGVEYAFEKHAMASAT